MQRDQPGCENPTHEGPGKHDPMIAGPAVAGKTRSPGSIIITLTSLRDGGTGQPGWAADVPRSRAWQAHPDLVSHSRCLGR